MHALVLPGDPAVKHVPEDVEIVEVIFSISNHWNGSLPFRKERNRRDPLCQFCYC